MACSLPGADYESLSGLIVYGACWQLLDSRSDVRPSMPMTALYTPFLVRQWRCLVLLGLQVLLFTFQRES